MLEIVRIALALLIVITPALLAGQASTASPEALAKALQDRYRSVRDFSGEFTQTYRGGALRTRTVESGTVAIKQPGKMRWIYTKPERKEFVSNGERVYSYLPADKQVIVSPMPASDQTTPALFLTGRGHLVRDFTATFAQIPDSQPGVVGLKLVPRKHDPEIEWLMLGVDAKTLQIRQLVAADRQGGRSSFTFNNLKENRNLSDKLFEFQVPRGVDVITNGVPAK